MPKAGSRRPPTELFWRRVNRDGPNGCWVWTGGRDPDGYGIFSETLPPGSARPTRSFRAHRYAWALTHGSAPDGKVLMHSCDNPRCVNPAHLSIGTTLDNNRDAFAKGRRRAAGEHNIKAKLTSDDVLSIRASREIEAVLAVRYGVCLSTIYSIRVRRTWAHVADPKVEEPA